MQKKRQRVFYRVNYRIQAPQVRVIAEDGSQVGVMPVNQALALARQKQTDLVEVAPKAKPPVCKLIDFSKFKYLEAKKQKKSKTKSKDVKEVRLTPFTGDNDLVRLSTRAADFLDQGHKVKVVVKFTGRTINYKDFGNKILDKFLEILDNKAIIEQPAKLVGKRLITTLTANKNEKSKKDQAEAA